MQGYTAMIGEALDQIPEPPTHIFVQAGVGSLAGAVTGFFANLFPEEPPKVVIVEADTAVRATDLADWARDRVGR